WTKALGSQEILEIKFRRADNSFLVLTTGSLLNFSVQDQLVKEVFAGKDFTCFEILEKEGKILIGTKNGYVEMDGNTYKQIGDMQVKLPWPRLTVIKEIGGNIWFGSERGAFVLRDDGRFDYYYGERWLPGEKVSAIAGENGNTVLVLTDGGFSRIIFEEMTMHEKALFFEKQVRQRHIRYGFNATLVGMEKGNVDTGRLGDSDNDGLWTAMYLGGQAFR